MRHNTAPAGDAGHPSWARAIERSDQARLRAQHPGWLADAEEVETDTAQRCLISALERVEQFLIPGVSSGVIALDGQTAKSVAWARRTIVRVRENGRSGLCNRRAKPNDP